MSTIDPPSSARPAAGDRVPSPSDLRIAGFQLPTVRWHTPHGSCEAPVGHLLNSDAVVRNGLPAGYERVAIRQPDKCSHEAAVVDAGQRTDEVDAVVVVVRRDERGRTTASSCRWPISSSAAPTSSSCRCGASRRRSRCWGRWGSDASVPARPRHGPGCPGLQQRCVISSVSAARYSAISSCASASSAGCAIVPPGRCRGA